MTPLHPFPSYFQIYSPRDNSASAVPKCKPDDERTEHHSGWVPEKSGAPETLLALETKKSYLPI